jgi:hypothetical protein
MHKPKVVGIVGASFCGSTLVGILLDSLPDVRFLGETHHIHDADRPLQCRCWADCKELGFKVQLSALADKTREEWWARLSAGSPIVVSGDKNKTCYSNFPTPDELIVQWKDPRAWVVSWAIRMRGPRHWIIDNDRSPLAKPDVLSAVKVFNNFHDRAIKWVSGLDRPTHLLMLDDLLAMPEVVCGRLAKQIGSTGTVDLDFRSREQHYIRSNEFVKVSPDTQQFGHIKPSDRLVLKPNETWREFLSPALERLVKGMTAETVSRLEAL